MILTSVSCMVRKPPFYYHFAARIKSQYPQPWSETGKKVVAFALGAMSHSVADILWHDIDDVHQLTSQGLIRAQAEIYFFGDYSHSHTAADVGGEFAFASQASTSCLASSWFIPALDIIETYRNMGIIIEESELRLGMTEAWAEAQLASLVWKIADPTVQRFTTFLQEELFNYFIGGIEDSAQWSARCWPNFITWLEQGPDLRRLCLVEPPTTLTPSISKLHRHSFNSIMVKLRSLPSFAAVHSFISKFVIIDSIADGKNILISFDRTMEELIALVDRDLVTLLAREMVGLYTSAGSHRANNPLILSKSTHYDLLRRDSAAKCVPISQLPKTMRLSSDVYYSNLGESLTYGDFDGDKKLELAIGAPGYTAQPGSEQAGAVFLLDLPNDLSERKSLRVSPSYSNMSNLLGFTRSGRFGSSLATVDLNRDGFDDLVVSEPRFGNELLQYQGRVFVIYGSSKGLSINLSTVIVLRNNAGNFTMMGTSLSSGDLDNDGFADLIIGSPYSCRLDGICDHRSPNATLQSGAVSIFLSSNWTSPRSIQLTDAEVTIQGQARYNWLGMQAKAMTESSLPSGPVLIVSSPIGPESSSLSAPGTVLSYDWSSIRRSVGSQPISSPFSKPSPQGSLSSSTASSKLGWSLSLGNPYSADQSSEFIAISAPTMASDSNPASVLTASGRVFLAPLASVSRSFSNTDSLMSFSGSEERGRFGWSTLLSDVNSDGYDELFISAPFEADQMGRIYAWKGGSSFPTTPVTSSSSDLCIELDPLPNPAMRSRFGHSTLSVPLYKGLLNDRRYLVVSAPRDSCLQEDGGSVFLIDLTP